MSEMQRIEGETDTEFAARLRETADRVRGAWGGEEEARKLLARANRVERGEE